MSKSKSLRRGGNISQKYKKRPDAFLVKVNVEPTDEKFKLNNVYYEMTVSDLKDEVEFACGIPVNLQRLCYLDEGELQDDTTIRNNDLVPGGTIRVKVWSMYKELIKAVVNNDIDLVFKLGVTDPSDYHTPASDYMTKRSRKQWLEERGLIALGVAAHRGHEELVVKLIQNGVDVNGRTSTGKTALHLAAAKGQGEIVNVLLHSGSDINAEDKNGNTPLSVAERFGSKVCSRHLFQFQWQERSKDIKRSKQVPNFAHQYYDSSTPVWKRGRSAQIYVTNILKPGEFEGTALSAPKGGRHPSALRKQIRNATFFSSSPESNASELEDYFPDESGLCLPPIDGNSKPLKKPLTYSEWLEKQKAEEKRIAVEKKRLEKKQNSGNENMDQDEADKMGYEKWLAQKEQEKQSSSQFETRENTTTLEHSKHVAEQEDGALRLYLRSLGKSKTGVEYEQWLNEKESEINDLVQQLTKQQTR